jgi:hypothetical protein
MNVSGVLSEMYTFTFLSSTPVGDYWMISGGYSDGLGLSAGSSAFTKYLQGQFMNRPCDAKLLLLPCPARSQANNRPCPNRRVFHADFGLRSPR